MNALALLLALALVAWGLAHIKRTARRANRRALLLQAQLYGKARAEGLL